jgi:L-glyceraldehyde 3-phosphate reductase
MAYEAASERYSQMEYRTCGRSGLKLPALSLGLWHNFGDTTPLSTQRDILRTAFGSAETNFGRLFKDDFKPYRDELLISSKAGWDMWPGPYGQGGGSRKYVLASLDQSLKRMGLDYVDIFYSHRFDADTPLEETAGALATAVHSGKALYVGISSYSAAKTREMAKLLAGHKVPLLIHQPSYNMLNRWIESELLDTLDDIGAGSIAFTPLAQGLLTSKYLNGVPQDARINKPGGGSLKEAHLSAANIEHVRKLNELAGRRGQSLAQMALAWALRGGRVTSVLIGASRAEQVVENVGALKNLAFSSEELAEIDQHAKEGGVDLWEKPSTDQRV